ATAGLCSIGVTSAFTGIATTYGPPDGESPQGGNCAMMKWLPLAPQFHVAINDNQYDTGANCGRCVSVTCVDARCQSKRTVLGQVMDRCPECSQGDLDMSLPMFQQVTGFTTDRLAISWEFVDCPVTDGVQVCAKDGSSIHWLYVQPGNTLNGVKSMRINGGDAPLFGSAYYFMSTVLGTVDLSQTQVEMTSHSGQTIKATVALVANQCTQISQQFSGVGGGQPSPPATPSPPTQAPVTQPPPTTQSPPPTQPPSTTSPPTQAPVTLPPPTQPSPTTTPSTTEVPTTSSTDYSTTNYSSTNYSTTNYSSTYYSSTDYSSTDY
ncbi:hypothetical protein AaE_002985, partial [Aphanomyces astaci]